MDSSTTAAGRALRAGDSLGALKRRRILPRLRTYGCGARRRTLVPSHAPAIHFRWDERDGLAARARHAGPRLSRRAAFPPLAPLRALDPGGAPRSHLAARPMVDRRRRAHLGGRAACDRLPRHRGAARLSRPRERRGPDLPSPAGAPGPAPVRLRAIRARRGRASARDELGRGRRSRNAARTLGLRLPASQRPMHPRVRRLLRILHSSGVDDATSLEALARSVGLSPSRLMHVFTESIGIPLRPYLSWLMAARGHGHRQRQPSRGSAHTAGFADASHMTRTFKRMLGVPPSVLRPMSCTTRLSDDVPDRAVVAPRRRVTAASSALGNTQGGLDPPAHQHRRHVEADAQVVRADLLAGGLDRIGALPHCDRPPGGVARADVTRGRGGCDFAASSFKRWVARTVTLIPVRTKRSRIGEDTNTPRGGSAPETPRRKGDE